MATKGCRRRAAPGRWLGLPGGFGALGAILVLSAIAAGEARATASVTPFSEGGFSGEFRLEAIDGIPANADLDLLVAPQDPVSFLVSLALDPGSEVVLNLGLSVRQFLQEPSPVAIGWLPGNGTPGSEPDTFLDLMGYGSGRDPYVGIVRSGVRFGTLVDWQGNFTGGLHPGETSNLFFVSYERSVARNVDSILFRLDGADFDPYGTMVLVPVPQPSAACLLAGGLGMLLLYARVLERSRRSVS